MEAQKSVFNTLNAINVNEHTEKKNGLTYLSWAWAWSTFKQQFPNANYEILRNKEQGDNPMFKSGTTFEVRTRVTADGTFNDALEMWLPVLDYRNKPIEAPNSFDVNTALMRCLTKNLAMFGLGLYIYAGEDIPQAPTTQLILP